MTAPTAAPPPEVQQLLAQMHDIQAPPPVGWWPPAPGWWALAALAVLAGIAIALWLRRKRARSAYKRTALSLVSTLRECDAQTLVPEANALLKRTALCAYGSEKSTINQAFGPGWVEWLNGCCKNPVFTGAAASALAGGGYRGDVACDRTELLAAVARWIKQHRGSHV